MLFAHCCSAREPLGAKGADKHLLFVGLQRGRSPPRSTNISSAQSRSCGACLGLFCGDFSAPPKKNNKIYNANRVRWNCFGWVFFFFFFYFSSCFSGEQPSQSWRWVSPHWTAGALGSEGDFGAWLGLTEKGNYMLWGVKKTLLFENMKKLIEKKTY